MLFGNGHIFEYFNQHLLFFFAKFTANLLYCLDKDSQQDLAVLFIVHTRCTGMNHFCRKCVQLLQLTESGKYCCWLQSSEFCSTGIR